ncbi:MAG TPA: NAD(P)/FAD-dependent oxidoreductase [Solirubrobacterales bacterium]|nr:NAD(P)/FAD-dependent oxidoreductase [Solirubrobacterales bacterium]
MRSADVVVLGAGLAGLVAARELRARGLDVVVLEGRDRVGGRTLYRRCAGTEWATEFGGTWINPASQLNVAREVERYGIPVVEDRPHQIYRWYLGGHEREGLPVTAAEAPGVERAIVELVGAARRLDFEAPLDRQDLADLDVPLTDFLQALDLPDSVSGLVCSMASLYSGAHSDEYSALHLLHRIAQAGLSPFQLFAGLSHRFERGSSSLVEALLEDAAPDLRLSTRVLAVAERGDEVVMRTAGGEELRAARAVVTVPLNTLGAIDWDPQLGDGKRALARERHAGHGIKLWAHVEGRQPDFAAIGWGTSNLTWVSAEHMADGGSLLMAFGYSTPELDLSDRAAVESVLREFAPGVRVIAVDFHDWNDDPFSLGTWMAWRAGHMSRHMSAAAAAEGRLVFAGADTAIESPGKMEGALETGMRAARELLAAPNP